MIRSIFLIFLLTTAACRRDSGISALPGDGSCDGGSCGARVAGFHDPAWSPDGTRIAVTKAGIESTPPGLYEVGADGSDLRQILVETDVRTPVWNADGTVLFAIAGTDILRVPMDGSPPRRITNRGSYSRLEIDPAGSSLLAHFDPRTRKSAQSELERAGVVRLDTAGSITAWVADGWMAAWTGDGQAFWLVERLPSNPSATRLIRYDAGTLARTDTLSPVPSRFVSHPKPSPSGDRILFSGQRLYRHTFASKTTAPVTSGAAERSSWNPTGSRIAYADGNGQVWVMNADGSGRSRLLPR